jgi:hypothetical protein
VVLVVRILTMSKSVLVQNRGVCVYIFLYVCLATLFGVRRSYTRVLPRWLCATENLLTLTVR